MDKLPGERLCWVRPAYRATASNFITWGQRHKIRPHITSVSREVKILGQLQLGTLCQHLSSTGKEQCGLLGTVGQNPGCPALLYSRAGQPVWQKSQNERGEGVAEERSQVTPGLNV